MKKINFLLITMLLVVCFILTGCSKNTFKLEDKYYENSSFNELEVENFNNLIKDKESFAIFIYQPLCSTSYEFNKVVTNFANKHQISFYKMSFANMKETELKDKIKYYPSLVIYKDGEIVDFLDANSDEDTKYYKTYKGFKEWFTTYVEAKEISYKEQQNINSFDPNLKIDAVLKDVKYDENKINIYFFWGNGCPHCEEAFKFLESIKTEYGNYFTLHTFEVWYNEENEKMLNQFANSMKDEVTGVPYIIVGKESFRGFSEKTEEKILEAIKNQYKNSYDVYFENINN